MKKLFCIFIILSFSFSAFSQREKKYRGAEIRTIDTFLYGKFEVRVKSSQASGMVASFFTFYDEPDFPQNWNEIDIEFLGRYDNEVQFNSIIGHHTMKEHRQVVDFNPHEDFHTYAFEWYPDSIVWFIDGKRVYAQKEERIKNMNKPQKIMMNIWPPNIWAWSGVWADSVLPLYATYDYVKYYAYTPEKSERFTHKWTEEFKYFDSSRWQKASHTFRENNSEFIHDNAVVKDGYLILCLTKKDEIGYRGADIKDKHKFAVSLKFVKEDFSNPKHIILEFDKELKEDMLKPEFFKVKDNKVEEVLKKEGGILLKLREPLRKKQKYQVEFSHPLNENGILKKRFKVAK